MATTRRGALLVAALAIAPLFANAADRPVITVLDFRKEGVSDQEMRSIVSLMTTAVFRSDRYDVIDVAQRESLLKEMEFSATDCSEESCQLQMGRLLAAELIIVGSLGKVGTNWILSAKILDTATGKTLSAADGVYRDLDLLIAGMPKLVAELTGGHAAPRAAAKERRPIQWKTVFGVAAVAGGVASAGVGGYFLYHAYAYNRDTVIPTLETYDAARAGSLADFDTLWSTYETAFSVYKRQLTLGAALASAGLSVGVAGIALLAARSKSPVQPPAAVTVSVSPCRGGAAVLLTVMLGGHGR